MNCFIDRGDGENLENLSTCFGIPPTKLFFSKNWANFIFSPLPFADPNSETNSPFSLQHSPVWRLSASSVSYLWRASRKLPVGSPVLLFSSSVFAFYRLLCAPQIQLQCCVTCVVDCRRGRGEGSAENDIRNNQSEPVLSSLWVESF